MTFYIAIKKLILIYYVMNTLQRYNKIDRKTKPAKNTMNASKLSNPDRANEATKEKRPS